MSKRKKFNLSHLVHGGSIKDGETLYYVSDPAQTCKVAKQFDGEYKVTVGKETMTIHGFAQKCLGQEPPDHATKWIRTEKGPTLFDLWHAKDMEEAA